MNGHTFEEHRLTPAYQEAKERMLNALAKWGGVIRRMPGAEEDPVKRRAELQQQARELLKPLEPEIVQVAMRAEAKQTNPEITDADLPVVFFENQEAEPPFDEEDFEIPF